MPADDLVLNVRQIASYTPATSAPASASILMQIAGLGSAYQSISPADLVATALAQGGGGNMAINGSLSALSISGGALQFANGSINLFSAQRANFGAGCIAGVPIATVGDVAALAASSVRAFEGRVGDVCLWLQDIIRAGGAPNFSPVFGGCPRAPTPPPSSYSTRLATTEFVQQNSVLYIQNLLDTHPFVFTFNGRSGAVVLTAADIVGVGGEVFDSPTFTGVPTAPTAPVGTNTDQIATTAYVMAAQFAPINNPTFTGFPSGPTAAPGTTTGQLATTAFVQAAVTAGTAGVSSFNTRTGAVVLTALDLTAAGGALLASPTFTGTPQAPTAAPGTANTQIATTAFVANYGGVTSFNTRIGAVVLTTADITGAGGAPLASPAFTGTPTAPTMAGGNSSTAIATTAFVMTAIGNAVSSFNGRTGAVTLNSSDISAAGGAPAASPVFSGTPEAPTPAPGNNSTQLATTAYVQAALAAGGGVTSFNGRAGVVTLTGADITAAGGALLTSLPAASTSLPLMNGSATAGASALYARGDHVHPSDTTRLALTGGTMTGAITVPAVVGGGLILNGAAGSTRSIVASTNSVNRWVLQLGNNTAETGSNAGSNIAIWACNDAGALLGAQSALAIVRASQTVALGGGLLSIFPGSLNPSPGVALLDSGGSSQVQIYYDVTNLWFICSYGSVWHRLNPSGNFQVAAAGSVQPGGGPWVAPSDDRIKTVTGDFDQGLEAVLALRPVSYVYNGNDSPSADVNAEIGRDPKASKPNVRQAPYPGSDHYLVAKARTQFVGFVAQELEAIAPAMVTRRAGFIDGQPVSDMRDVNGNNLVYMLINAVKTLAARVAALEAT